MKKMHIYLACASLLAVAACSSTSTRDGMASKAASAALPNATVTLIEPLAGASSMGSSGTAGSASGSSTPTSRVSLRLDDGSTRTINVERPPSYKAGDRVNVSLDMINPTR
jgi:hypothetical protein